MSVGGATRALEDQITLAEQNITFLQNRLTKLANERNSIARTGESTRAELDENVAARDECARVLATLSTSSAGSAHDRETG